jgi:hypothetical protein
MRHAIGSFRSGTFLLFAAGVAAALPSVAEASLARRLGTSYSTSLSSNTSTRTQSLTGDPDNVIRGSASATYEPGKVLLDAIYPLEDFRIERAYVEVSFDDGETTDLIEYERFLLERSPAVVDNPFVETGYLQVFFAAGTDAPPPPDPGMEVDRGGEFTGDKTHMMVFNFIAPDPTTVANYTYYADNGSRGTSPDFLVFRDTPEGGGELQEFTATASQITGAEVSGPLVVPEPSTALLALAGGGLAVLRRRRR